MQHDGRNKFSQTGQTRSMLSNVVQRPILGSTREPFFGQPATARLFAAKGLIRAEISKNTTKGTETWRGGRPATNLTRSGGTAGGPHPQKAYFSGRAPPDNWRGPPWTGRHFLAGREQEREETFLCKTIEFLRGKGDVDTTSAG